MYQISIIRNAEKTKNQTKSNITTVFLVVLEHPYIFYEIDCWIKFYII